MFTTVLKYQNPYGGYFYVEYSIENKAFAVGDSNSMVKHARNYLPVKVSRKKDITETIERLDVYKFKKIPYFK